MLFKKSYNKLITNWTKNESNNKLKKKWVHKGSEFYNRSKNSWLEKNDMEIYSTHNEGKSVIAERFIRTLKNNVYKNTNLILNNLYIDQ